ncbi:MAG TPA: AAA family ATPase [Ruminococcus sp.]|nr:AAA family ATPase [Ruminococcus sp.]
MLLKSITLTDFRNFKGTQSVDFADDPQKNVTVIMGENGSGKTTFAQAFTWCLYGATDFTDKMVMSKSTLQDMKTNEGKRASVEIKLQHKNTTYTICRQQEYRRDANGQIKSFPTKLTICYKNKDGQQEFVPETIVEYKIKEILPAELSGYFFFNGERIEKMSKEIQSGRSPEFASAVKKLLGLDTYTAALNHLKGQRAGKTTVIGYYNGQYDSSSDSRVGEYTRRINQKNNELENKKVRKEELDNSIPTINEEIIRLAALIENNKNGEMLRSQIKSYEDRIRMNDEFIGNSTSVILKSFNNNYKYYFLKKVMSDALEVLVDADKMDKGIPDIHKRTIDFLIKRGTCICGRPISEDSAEHKELLDLLDYIPPQSLGTMIHSFAKECKSKSEMGEDLLSVITERLSELAERQSENDKLNTNIQATEEKIAQFEDVGKYQSKLSSYRKDYNNKLSELSKINREIGDLDGQIERLEGLRSELSLKNENNKKVELYKAYAERIYEVLQNDYVVQEERVRTELQNCINDIFKQIYNGGFELEIDDKYNVTTIVKDFADFNVGVETSTAQSISVIFAFIAGVIKMARSNENNEELATEAYPLVMDAPLSAFDKTRIQTVCDTLPNIAEQVIIFIKDTDGEIAEKYLSSKIGKSYSFDKKNEFETFFSER